MNSRERTFLTLQHKPADRIPIDFWATDSVVHKIERELDTTIDDFLDRYDVDLRYIEGPRYAGPELDDNADIWGVRRVGMTAGCAEGTEAYSEVLEPPLKKAANVEDIESYAHWPDPDWFDYSVIEAQCDAILEKERVVVFMGDRLNRIAQLKPAMYLRGTQEIFMDLAMQPEMAEAIISKIRTFYLEYLARILEAAKGKIDIVLTGDDFGAQNGLLMSVEMWRRFIKSGFKAFNDLIKAHNATTMHHTCGSVIGIIPDMIECGLDVLQSIQPEAAGMSLANLKSKFGERLSFQGGISIQKTMPYGTREEIRDEVRSIADIIKHEGGYIFCTSHNLQADTSIDNIVTLMGAYHEYGK